MRMKKYFYYVAQYHKVVSNTVTHTTTGVCESNKDGLFPLIEVLSKVINEVKSHIRPKAANQLVEDSVRVTNVVEISKDDYLMASYEEVNGKDFEK